MASVPQRASRLRLGILGGGQLGRMLALAAHRLGVVPVVYADARGPASEAAAEFVEGPWAPGPALDAFLTSVDAVTYELEHFPREVAEYAEARVRLAPNAASLVAAQDRLLERELAARVGIPTAPYARVDRVEDLELVERTLGFPVLLKRRFGGYDGKGQALVARAEDFARAFESLGGAAIAEALVRFRREVSVIGVRSADGEVRVYPPAENLHVGGVLRRSEAPAPGLSRASVAHVEDYARRVLEALGYVGVIALELFETDDAWLLNEVAPRVHNSGHWTMDGAGTCQFENHVRAVLGLPLGSAAPRGPGENATTIMVNLLGSTPPLDALAAAPNTHVHLYGKEPRPGRKLGHVNVTGNAAERAAGIAALEQLGVPVR